MSSHVRLLPLVLLLLACARGTSVTRLEPVPGKRTEGRTGMVAASHPDAAAAGAAILRQGGNAVDAAVATAFALSVVDPSQTGLGGGGAAVVWLRGPRTADVVDFMAASGADSLWSVAASTPSGQRHGRAAAVPGTVAGLLHLLERHGSLSRAAVMAPAIRLARDGFVVSPLLSRTITSSLEKLRVDSLALARFAPGGTPLQPGDRLVQPELAATLARIAGEGATAFYAGDVARRLAHRVRETGGLITEADLRDFRVVRHRPVCARFAGHTLLSAAPTLSGMSVAEALGIFEHALPEDSAGRTLAESPRAAVVLAEAMRLADADRLRWRGDPGVMPVPARGIASAAFAAERAALVGRGADSLPAGDPWQEESAAPPAACAALDPYPAAPRSTSADAPGPDTDDGTSNTSHLSVVDARRNAVSMTFTVGVLFGSGVYTDGFFLNSAGTNFDRRTAGPNRRNNSTMAPTILLEGNDVRLVVGAAGSQYIPPAVVQTVVHVARYGRDVGDALAAPRLSPGRGRELEIEPGWSPAVYTALRAAGYTLRNRIADMQFGGVHAVQVRRDGRLIGAADPRRDGVAVGF